MTPDRLGKYEIRGTLGKGAMGVVYAAWDPAISRQVAIKTVRLPDAAELEAQEELARFKREAQAAGRLNHPNIVGIFDYGETGEVAFIVMEFVDGRTLKGMLDGEERVPVPTVARIMADLLAGLSYSHERGVVHRDIKPANLMVVTETGQAKIADFGIARIESSNLTQAGTIMGTPAYMSPEQFMGQTVDARTDIYSAGVLLFQLLTGERPFEGSMATIMHKALNVTPPKPSELSVTAPQALDAVVARAMQRRPEDRYPTAAAFAEAIVAALAKKAVVAAPDEDATIIRPQAAPSRAAAESRPAKPRSRAPVYAAAGFVALAAAGAGAAWQAGLFGKGEVPTTPAVAASPPGKPDVVAVSPPTTQQPAPAAAASAEPGPSPTPAAPTQAAAAQTTEPPPRDVAQVVPPSTTRTEASPAAPVQPGAQPPRPATLVPAQPTPTAPAAGDEAAATTSRRGLDTSQVPAETATVPPPTPPTTSSPATPAVSSAAPPRPAEPPVAAVTTKPDPAPATQALPTPQPAAAEPTPPSAPTAPVAVAEAGLSPDALRRAVQTATQGATCAVVRGDVSSAGALTVEGVVGAGAATALLDRLRDTAPNATVDWHVREANGPYCDALNLAHVYARQSGGVEVGLKDNRVDLVTDDPIDVRATMPGFPSYLQVDYFASDGSVAHVRLSAQGTPALPPRSNQSFVLGAAAEPYGTDLIVATASSVPLFPKGKALAETGEAYLRELRAAVDAARAKRADLAAGVVVVHTAAKS